MDFRIGDINECGIAKRPTKDSSCSCGSKQISDCWTNWQLNGHRRRIATTSKDVLSISELHFPDRQPLSRLRRPFPIVAFPNDTASSSDAMNFDPADFPLSVIWKVRFDCGN